MLARYACQAIIKFPESVPALAARPVAILIRNSEGMTTGRLTPGIRYRFIQSCAIDGSAAQICNCSGLLARRGGAAAPKRASTLSRPLLACVC
eukprot:2918096-Pleurochrysis_carterae.AAC.3